MAKQYPEYKLNLPAVEEEVQRYWNENSIFEKSISSREGSPSFTFYEGPPSANGMPGIHHVIARSMKDIFCRYKTLQGYQVLRKGGWDTHGLPVELQVEKMLGIRKDDIGKKISVEEYNQACRTDVLKYKNVWDDLTRKMGYWVDLDNPYVTFENDYIETVWHLLKMLWEKDLLYKGFTIQPYSPAAGTGLSSHELNQPGTYRDVKDTTAVAMFLWKGTENDAVKSYFLAWTTTPWTLPANTALAVGANIVYDDIETLNPYTFERVRVVLAHDLTGKYFTPAGENASFDDYLALPEANRRKHPLPWKFHGNCKGKELVGTAYHPLFEEVELVQQFAAANPQAFQVIAGDFVSTEDGTGIVHISPTFGADDNRVAIQAGIPGLFTTDSDGNVSPIVDRQGKYVPSMGPWANRWVKSEYNPEPETHSLDVELSIWLKEKGRAFHVEKYAHSYPHCWRTDKPILYYPLDSWFIRTTAKKDRMVELNKTINWKPASTGTGRFGNWLENMVDWNLSRSRYWGIPLPVWRTEDGKEELCIGSVESLLAEGRKAVAAGLMEAAILDSFAANPDLHKPYVDNIVLVSPSGQPMFRETDLIDVWFDSGAMPYAQWHYPFENVETFQKNFPADFIAEGVDQTRGWFYTLHAIAVMLFDSVAFKAVISNGLVLDKKGQKMSKRLGNAADPFETIASFGADSTRWYMVGSSQPWDNLLFDIEGVKVTRNRYFSTLYNTYAFFATYANVDGFEYGTQIPVSERTELDRWVISVLNTLIGQVQAAMDDYDATGAIRAIDYFVTEQLSNWYVRLSRRRFWKGEMNREKEAAYQTLFECLTTVSQLMSSFAPFYAEKLYRDLTGGESVHLTEFPEANAAHQDSALEARMKVAQDVTSLILSIRSKHQLKIRQPLQKALVAAMDEQTRKNLDAVADLIMSETNVKGIEYLTSDSNLLVKSAKPNFKAIGQKPELRAHMQQIKAELAELNQQQIATLEQTGSLALSTVPCTVTLAEIEIASEDIPGWAVATENGQTVALDITLNDALVNEGIARELVNRIQNLRKSSQFEVTDRITLVIEDKAEWQAAIAAFGDYICRETLANTLETAASVAGETVEVYDVEGAIAVQKA